MATVTCLCPPKPSGEVRHPDGDRIELREKLDFRAALTCRNAIVMVSQEDPEAPAAVWMAALTEMFLLEGVRKWTLQNEKGKPIEVSRPAIREYLLSNIDVAMEVGEEADELYAAAVVGPLARKVAAFSQPTPTAEPISATNGQSPTPLKRSRRSSTSTTRTDGIAAMP